MQVVAKDLKTGTEVGVGPRNATGIKPDLAEAIKEEQKKLKLLKNANFSSIPAKATSVPSAATTKQPQQQQQQQQQQSPPPGPDDKTTTKKQLMSSSMGRKELLDIFGSLTEIPSDQVFADLEKEGIYLLKKRNARFPKVFCDEGLI